VLESNHVVLQGKRIAVQEYGIPSRELVEHLKQRGAEVMTIHVYDWALPEDIGPLKDAVGALLKDCVDEDRIDTVLFTAAVQVHHLLQVAEGMCAQEALVSALHRVKVASIGPVTSKALREYGIPVSLEPSHPKMGFLVKEASELPAR
jgi:uroporphyrinogen-III synthase